MQNTSHPSFYIYDFETFGTHAALDRPAQFAGLRVDQNFNIIGEPLVIYCKQSDDYLPHPEAVMITGITPQLCNQKGVTESEFADLIHKAFSVPNSCILGYNTIKFDDEVTRHLFYRNFIDPYAHHWQHGNSRWDMIDVVRATYALRPEGINWPLTEEGLPSFKLEALTKANNIEHSQAHDAMSDVYATIEIMKLILAKQPRLFQYLYQHRDKQKLIELIDIINLTPLVHISSFYGSYRSNLSIIAPIAWHPSNKNAVICVDLTYDITPLLELSAIEIQSRLYKPKNQLTKDELPIGITVIYLNKCPILAPEKTLLPENIKRLNLDIELIQQNHSKLKAYTQLKEKLNEIFDIEKVTDSHTVNDVDNQLYTQFFSQSDKLLFEQIRTTEPKNLPLINITSDDNRIKELFFRYKARNFPATLDFEEQQAWIAHRKSRLNPDSVANYINKLEEIAAENQHDENKLKLLKQLFFYLQSIAN
ncbi:exodeoxyribonuclease I [Thorsellia anophelis]|uniref:Exodeoxyribonuclease I n=1 Tax=Thorsellia anophelis DSM 18579 TaxID=1123402 RepID=A0A1I0A8E3_9GAMM|nr:exodeoxyribonuclease I [Thorsellia anophelis]SES90416.1 Exodeoxyribonuclease I subunit C [Thorsellia anophelis DSM 18579]